MKIVVASKNPVKINAVKEGFQGYFSETEVESISVESDVPDQPMSDEETLTGARNRAQNARKLFGSADFWVGIEGGVDRDKNGLTAFAWIVILDHENSGESRTTSFQLPGKVTRLIDEGFELGHANDIVFHEHNSKQNSGAVGLLTGDLVTRTGLYRQAVQLALIPFVNRVLYAVNDH